MPATPTPRFAATRWTIVLAAGNWRADPAAKRAMSDLAQRYWFPLYAYLRRNAYLPHTAEDLIQSFFTHLLENDALLAVDPARGKFRSFLLASLKNFLANEHDKTRAQKRGGNQTLISLDAPESRYIAEPMHHLTPDRVYDRRWALALLEQVLTELKQEYIARNQSALFIALESLLAASAAKTPYQAIAQQLHTTEGAIKVAAHRLRKRYRQLLRDHIAQTVADPTLIDEEIRHLLISLQQNP